MNNLESEKTIWEAIICISYWIKNIIAFAFISIAPQKYLE